MLGRKKCTHNGDLLKVIVFAEGYCRYIRFATVPVQLQYCVTVVAAKIQFAPYHIRICVSFSTLDDFETPLGRGMQVQCELFGSLKTPIAVLQKVVKINVRGTK